MFVLGAALIVLLIGPHHDEDPALIVIVIVLFMLVIGAAPGRRRASFDQTLSARQERFHPRRRLGEELPDAQTEADASRLEREIYAEREDRPDG
jgi:hypothetical protein